jgi:hypothetical protein
MNPKAASQRGEQLDPEGEKRRPLAMSLDLKQPRSRRALLAGVAGGAAAVAASMVDHLPSARAGIDGDVVLGQANAETTTTSITNSTDGVDGLAVTAAGTSTAVTGHSNGIGVRGTNASSISAAVLGHNESNGTGVEGYSSGFGFTVQNAPQNTGVLGVGGTVVGTPARGVHGFSGSTGAPAAPAQSIGVFGQAQDKFGTGVWGRAPTLATGNSAGVIGEGNTGVLGAGTFGTVGSAAATGIGVYGSVSNSPGVPAVFGKTGVIGQSDAGGTGMVGFTGLTDPSPPAKTGVYGYAAEDNFSRGVIGQSPAGIGVYGITSSGYAGYFAGKVFTTAFHEMQEVSTPAAPGANRARLFLKDNGLGKTQLCVRFNTGAVKVLATQP